MPVGSDLKGIVLRLEGFHNEMSFLGSIGSLMASSGLQELFDLVYAHNAVEHMLSGKAVDPVVSYMNFLFIRHSPFTIHTLKTHS